MKLIMRRTSVRWQAGAHAGPRIVSTGSGVLKQVRYASGLPLKENSATDPAELIAVAHAGTCDSVEMRPLRFSVKFCLYSPRLIECVTLCT